MPFKETEELKCIYGFLLFVGNSTRFWAVKIAP